jgi:chromosome segregation ATPase
MATASAPILEQTRQNVSALEAEISALRIRLATEESDLAALQSERADLAEKIALGELPASKASAIARRIEESEVRIAGFRSIIDRKQGELNVLHPELRRLDAEAKLAAKRAEAQTLRADGLKICERINARLLAIIKQDFPELDAIRDRLNGELRDVAAGADEQICRMLTLGNGNLAVELPLIDLSTWNAHSGVPLWTLRGDIQLQVRNLRKPKA